MEDRRLFDRFMASFPAKVKHLRTGSGSDIVLRDASATGCKFRSNQRMYVNDIIDLFVQLPDGREPLNLQGEVVWTDDEVMNGWHIGMKLSDVNLMRMQRVYNCCVAS